MNRGVFYPHGIFGVTVDGRILVMRTRGPWNKDFVDMYCLTVAMEAASLEGAPWGLLATISDEGMHTPDSFLAMQAQVAEQRKQGRCATALIFDHLNEERAVREMFKRMYQAVGEPHAFFTHEPSARQWLLKEIARAAA